MESYNIRRQLREICIKQTMLYINSSAQEMLNYE